MPAPGDSPATIPDPPLGRDSNFRVFWAGQALSQLGEQISQIAIPVVAVLLLGATTFEVGLLDSASMVAFLVIGLPAGAWIDHLRKRRTMIWADAVRAIALASLPVAWEFGELHMWQLYVVGFVVGAASVFFDVSYQSFIPWLVPRHRIGEANGRLEGTAQVARLAGPALGGWLVGAITAPLALLATAVTYVCSFLALNLTHDAEEPHEPAARGSLRREISEGLHFVFGHPLLRLIVATTALSNFFGNIASTLFPILVLRRLGFSAQTMGLLFSIAAVGGLLGASVSPWIARRVGEARLIPLSAILSTVAEACVPLAVMVPREWAFAVLTAQGFLSSAAVIVYNVTQVTFRQQITPPELLGRMNASIRFCVWGVLPIATFLGGLLGSHFGLVPTLWIGGVGGMLAALPVVLGPFWKMNALPDAVVGGEVGGDNHN